MVDPFSKVNVSTLVSNVNVEGKMSVSE
ncbi:MAG: hypothetical protein RL204_2260, partial [Bacteroidota bacterium]